jgi:hypothetical protein
VAETSAVVPTIAPKPKPSKRGRGGRGGRVGRAGARGQGRGSGAISIVEPSVELSSSADVNEKSSEGSSRSDITDSTVEVVEHDADIVRVEQDQLVVGVESDLENLLAAAVSEDDIRED